MTFRRRFWQVLGSTALGALLATSALGAVTTRVVTAGGAGTTATIAPGGMVSIDVRLDVGTLLTTGTGLIGTGFRFSQLTPVANGFFSITRRSFVGSPFNNASSGTADATVLAPPSNLLRPDNRDNLGRTTVSPAVVRPAANTLAVNLTLTASVTTPPGTYRINVTPGVSFATDDAFNEYDISTGAPFTITVIAASVPQPPAPKTSN
jgi:hypothetical protein